MPTGNGFSIAGFGGVDNKSAPESLIEFERRSAVAFAVDSDAVDISRKGKLRRRKGYSLLTAGNFHSCWTSPSGVTFVVQDQTLSLVNDDYSLTAIGATSHFPLSYAQVAHEVFLSDGTRIWVYDGSLTQLIAVGSYDRSATDLDVTEDVAFHSAPPPGNVLAAYFGRLLVADSEAIWYSRGFFPRQFDLRYDFIPVSGVRMLAVVDDGVYVGTEKEVLFFQGRNPKQLQVRRVSGCGVVQGASGVYDGVAFKPEWKGALVAAWLSSNGAFLLGASGGSVADVTGQRGEFDVGALGCLLLRTEDGDSHLVAATAPGGNEGNFRAFDVAVAEVRRNGVTI